MPKARILRPEHAGTDMESTDIWKFVFHESYPTFKIANTGSTTITIPIGGSEAYFDVVHNLGYVPFYFCNIRSGSDSRYVTGLYPQYGIDIEVDDGGYTYTTNPSYYAGALDSNTVRIGVTLPFGTATSAHSFTVTWEIMLDEF